MQNAPMGTALLSVGIKQQLTVKIQKFCEKNIRVRGFIVFLLSFKYFIFDTVLYCKYMLSRFRIHVAIPITVAGNIKKDQIKVLGQINVTLDQNLFSLSIIR